MFILTVLIVVCLKIMKLGKAIALGTHFVDSKHDQNVAVHGYHHNRQTSIHYQAYSAICFSAYLFALWLDLTVTLVTLIREKKDQNSLKGMH